MSQTTQQKATGPKNAIYASDLNNEKIKDMAVRNSKVRNTHMMEHLLFHKVEQVDRLVPMMEPESAKGLQNHGMRQIVQQHLDKGKTLVIWQTLNGIQYQMYNY